MTTQKFDTRIQAAAQRHATSYIGHLPPQALDIEQAVLCAALLNREATSKVLENLTEPAFYSREHRFIFAAIRDVAAESQAVDMLTVGRQLKAKGVLERVGGYTYLDKIANTQPLLAMLPQHCKVVRQLYMRRVVQEVATTLQAKSYDELLDPLELVSEASQLIGNLFTSFDQHAGGTVSDYLTPTFEHLRQVVAHPGLTGVPTGMLKLNDATGGWQGGDLIILAGRPGMGKTAAMLRFALAACFEEDKHGVIFSLEMPVRQLMHRIISHESGVPYSKLRRGELPGGLTQVEELVGQCERLAKYGHRLHIEDGSSLSIEQLRAKCHRLHQQHPLGLVMVDYIQLMEAVKRSGNREQEIASISRGLKKLAKELNVPVIALSQLSRQVEDARDKRPELRHLRESGSIEQDADAVVMLWRPECYKITELEDGQPTTGLMLLDFKKNRNGNLGEVWVGCNIACNALFDLENEQEISITQSNYQSRGQRPDTAIESPLPPVAMPNHQPASLRTARPTEFEAVGQHADELPANWYPGGRPITLPPARHADS